MSFYKGKPENLLWIMLCTLFMLSHSWLWFELLDRQLCHSSILLQRWPRTVRLFLSAYLQKWIWHLTSEQQSYILNCLYHLQKWFHHLWLSRFLHALSDSNICHARLNFRNTLYIWKLPLRLSVLWQKVSLEVIRDALRDYSWSQVPSLQYFQETLKPLQWDLHRTESEHEWMKTLLQQFRMKASAVEVQLSLCLRQYMNFRVLRLWLSYLSEKVKRLRRLRFVVFHRMSERCLLRRNLQLNREKEQHLILQLRLQSSFSSSEDRVLWQWLRDSRFRLILKFWMNQPWHRMHDEQQSFDNCLKCLSDCLFLVQGRMSEECSRQLCHDDMLQYLKTHQLSQDHREQARESEHIHLRQDRHCMFLLLLLFLWLHWEHSSDYFESGCLRLFPVWTSHHRLWIEESVSVWPRLLRLILAWLRDMKGVLKP